MTAKFFVTPSAVQRLSVINEQCTSPLVPSRAIVVIPCVHQPCVLGATISISEGSKISMYADDILLSKPINHPDNYDDLQRDIDAIQECISKYLIPH